MGTTSLVDRAAGQVIIADFFNSIHSAMNGDFVGRNTSGVATSGQALGTASIPWGTIRANALVINGASVDVSQISAPPFRVVSGATRSGSNQPAFLDPAGAAGGASVTVIGTATNLVYDVNGAAQTLSADIVKSSLTTAPAANNTCLVNDTDAAGSMATRYWGEEFHYNPNDPHKTQITIDTIGTEISGKDGQVGAFKNQTSGEYFLAEIDTTNNRLHKCWRGFFYDSSIAPVNRAVMNNNEVLQLMSLGWLFLDSDGTTVDVTYTEPVTSKTQPGSPATGDYWYDLDVNLQKRYDGAAWQSVNRTYIGMVIVDTADAVAVRCADFDKRFKADRAISLEKKSVTQLEAVGPFSKVNVYGSEIDFRNHRPIWNMTTDLAASADMYSATEQASRQYYFYISDEGEEIISDIGPYARRDLKGFYHPHNPWKCLSQCFNDSGSDLTTPAFWRMDEYGDIQTDWLEPETTILGATVTAPTKPSGIERDQIQLMRLRNGRAKVRLEYGQTDVTAAANGSGTYLWTLPGGLKAHTGKHVIDTNYAVDILGPAVAASDGAAVGANGNAQLYSQTQFWLMLGDAATSPRNVSNGYRGLADSTQYFSALLEISIEGWD